MFHQRLAKSEFLEGPGWGQSNLQGFYHGLKGKEWGPDPTEGRAGKGQRLAALKDRLAAKLVICMQLLSEVCRNFWSLSLS